MPNSATLNSVKIIDVCASTFKLLNWNELHNNSTFSHIIWAVPFGHLSFQTLFIAKTMHLLKKNTVGFTIHIT